MEIPAQVFADFPWPRTNRSTVKPLIKDTLKAPNKGQAKSTHDVYTLYRKSPLKEDSLSTIKDKIASPKSVLIKKFHCILEIAHAGIYLCWFLWTPRLPRRTGVYWRPAYKACVQQGVNLAQISLSPCNGIFSPCTRINGRNSKHGKMDRLCTSVERWFELGGRQQWPTQK